MDKKSETYKQMSKKNYELDEKRNEFEEAKENYRNALVDETIDNLLSIVKKGEELTERDLKLFLGDLSLQTKHLYSK